MRELALFAGAGGGLLGSHLLGWTTVCAVEIEEYPRRVLLARQKDGFLPRFPIWDDVRTFNGKEWKDRVDIITGGFPCQPFSVAGKRKAEKDDRNMWPATIDVIKDVKARYILLENVPGIKKYLPVVIRDLRKAGYTVKRPKIESAASLGAGHIRRRVWIYAYLTEKRLKNTSGKPATKTETKKRASSGLENCNAISADPDSKRQLQQEKLDEKERERVSDCYWWETEPSVERVVYGIPHGMDRLEALGEAQVPAMVRLAHEILS